MIISHTPVSQSFPKLPPLAKWRFGDQGDAGSSILIVRQQNLASGISLNFPRNSLSLNNISMLPDLCMSSLRKGHANLFVSFQFCTHARTQEIRYPKDHRGGISQKGSPNRRVTNCMVAITPEKMPARACTPGNTLKGRATLFKSLLCFWSGLQLVEGYE